MQDIEKATAEVIAMAEKEVGHHAITDGDEQVYAYRVGDGIHYGFNGGSKGFCLWQGVWHGANDQRNQRWKTGNPE
jgi:hypothetical protein